MRHRELHLPPSPDAALEEIRRASAETPVLVFKKSPICPVSSRVESELALFLSRRAAGCPEARIDLQVAFVDVLAEKALARGLCSILGIEHQSPQALLFRGGELVWHDSHFALNQAALEREIDGQASTG